MGPNNQQMYIHRYEGGKREKREGGGSAEHPSAVGHNSVSLADADTPSRGKLMCEGDACPLVKRVGSQPLVSSCYVNTFSAVSKDRLFSVTDPLAAFPSPRNQATALLCSLSVRTKNSQVRCCACHSYSGLGRDGIPRAPPCCLGQRHH